MGDMTESFSRSEFACRCGCGKDDIDQRLVNRLQVIRDITGIPMKIHSGCRCLKHNDDEGGEKGSLHLLGLAADWSFEGGGDGLLKKLCTKLINNWSGGFHFYPAKPKQEAFCHCDIGRRRRW